MTVIIIGDAGCFDETIRRMASIMGCSFKTVIKALDATSIVDNIMDTSFYANFPLYTFESVEAAEDCCRHDPELDSYFPRHGVFCAFLWINPSIIHDMLTVLVGYLSIFFHRKCFMQLKSFTNLRFA